LREVHKVHQFVLHSTRSLDGIWVLEIWDPGTWDLEIWGLETWDLEIWDLETWGLGEKTWVQGMKKEDLSLRAK